MTNAHSIARPYARAAFSFAKTTHQLLLWSHALKQLSCAVADTQMAFAIKNPSYTKKQLSELLIDVLHQLSGNGSTNGFTPIDNFIQLLSENKRLLLLSAVSELFETMLAKESGYLSLAVTSAYVMDDHQQQHVKEKLSQQLHSTLEIQFHVDPRVMSGLLVRSGNWVLDGTMTGQLQRLKSALV